jgi:4'-phosphopantetheinyl transferase
MRVNVFDRMDECTETEVQRMLPLVSAQRREQALRFKHTFGQYCCLKSWLILQDLVEIPKYRDIDFRYNEHGKPYWENGPYFSISHCKQGIAVAIDDQPIGIDIEGIRHADADLIARTMNEEELLRIKELGIREFTRLWTCKEAVVKAQGVGIQSFEQLQHIISKSRDLEISTFEKENYIYSIAYGKLHCFGA